MQWVIPHRLNSTRLGWADLGLIQFRLRFSVHLLIAKCSTKPGIIRSFSPHQYIGAPSCSLLPAIWTGWPKLLPWHPVRLKDKVSHSCGFLFIAKIFGASRRKSLCLRKNPLLHKIKNIFRSWREPWHKFEDWDWFNARNFCRSNIASSDNKSFNHSDIW